MANELDEATHKLVKSYAAAGDELAAQAKFKEAMGEYNKGWALIPEPKSEWEASTWLLAAIADAAYLGEFWQSAREALDYAMTCPGALGNPLLHLRRGEVLFEQKEFDAAANELMRAYMAQGPKIFASEPQKYLDFLRTRALIPK